MRPRWTLSVFLLIGLALLGFGGYRVYKNLTTEWEILKGVVARSEIREYKSTSSSDTNPSITWGPLLVYRYIYNGNEFKGAHQGVASGDYASAQRFVARHPVGSEVEIKVNPADPFDSILKQDFISENFQWLLLMLIGLPFALFGAIPLRVVVKVKRPAFSEGGTTGQAGIQGQVLSSEAFRSQAVECPFCHQLVVPVKRWIGGKKCPACGTKIERPQS